MDLRIEYSWVKFHIATAPRSNARSLSGRWQLAGIGITDIYQGPSFNIFSPKSVAVNELIKFGFTIPEEILNLPTNISQLKRYYDQIALRTRVNNLEPTGRGGVVDYYETVYRDADYEAYVPAMMDGKAEDDSQNKLTRNTKGVLRTENQRRSYYRNHWRRRQMSDHLPMWLELKIDFGENYLQKRFGQPI